MIMQILPMNTRDVEDQLCLLNTWCLPIWNVDLNNEFAREAMEPQIFAKLNAWLKVRLHNYTCMNGVDGSKIGIVCGPHPENALNVFVRFVPIEDASAFSAAMQCGFFPSKLQNQIRNEETKWRIRCR